MNAPKTILFVDDQRDLAYMLADTLAEHDWQAYVAFDLGEALQMVEQYHPCVVRLDIAMLHMSGYDVAVEMRARFGMACPILIARIARIARAENDLVQRKASRFAIQFLESSRESVRDREAALARGDVKMARELGHGIKLAARSTGAFRMADACQYLEQLAQRATTNDAARAMSMVAERRENRW